MMEVVWEKDNLPHRETIAMWDEHVFCYQPNPGRMPTKEELEACPEVFTCFCCLDTQPKKHLGGRYHGKWFCDFCIPYVDEWTAGVMVYWEEKRKKRTQVNTLKGSLTPGPKGSHKSRAQSSGV